jgi:hypothetical protein
MMLDDIGRPRTADLAKCFDVHPCTVDRWIKTDTMPRTAQLALFWLTRWGMGAVDAEATNQARMYAGLAACRATEVKTLQQTIERLLRLADFGSANDPVSDQREPRRIASFAASTNDFNARSNSGTTTMRSQSASMKVMMSHPSTTPSATAHTAFQNVSLGTSFGPG